MLILLPDALFEDDAEIEREVFADDVELIVGRERQAARIADDLWRRAAALIVYINIPIDAALIDKLAFI